MINNSTIERLKWLRLLVANGEIGPILSRSLGRSCTTVACGVLSDWGRGGLYHGSKGLSVSRLYSAVGGRCPSRRGSCGLSYTITGLHCYTKEAPNPARRRAAVSFTIGSFVERNSRMGDCT